MVEAVGLALGAVVNQIADRVAPPASPKSSRRRPQSPLKIQRRQGLDLPAAGAPGRWGSSAPMW